MAQLLVSVRSANEAKSALLGGADLIDVKEPSRGSLGRASRKVIQEVVDCVLTRTPVSAAMGELLDSADCPQVAGLNYAKWGPAGCQINSDWQDRIIATRRRLEIAMPACELVNVAYADWQRAGAPAPRQICDFTCKDGFRVLLIDTWRKDKTTLLDWLSVEEIAQMAGRCRAEGVKSALAGRLGEREIDLLLGTQPDWFAVRGAVCRQGMREQTIEAAAVRKLAGMLHASSSVPVSKIDSAYA